MKPKLKNSVLLIILFHLVGLIGFSFPISIPYFKLLVPFHILLMTVLVLYTTQEVLKKTAIPFLLLFLFGYFIEVVGVHSKLLFGNYYYGHTLGFKLFQVPPIMGLNWFLLLFSLASILKELSIPYFLKCALGASAMLLIDLFIEPVAQFYDYWHWNTHKVPFQNYSAWFLISLAVFALYFKFHPKGFQKIGWALYLSQLLFFVILSLLIH